MKTFFKILGVLIVLLIVLALILPFIFKGKITDLAKEEINKSVNATVDFSSINLSLIKSFPNFSLGIDDLTVVGKDKFESDTLAEISEIGVTLNLMSVISGSNYEIKKIKIINPNIHIKVLEDGSANYDIAPEGDDIEEEIPEEESSESGFVLTLKNVSIIDGNLIYDDASLGMLLSLLGLNHNLSGDFTMDNTTLKTNTTIEELNVNYDGVEYMKNVKTSYKADISADLKNEIYTLEKNNLFLNELLLNFDGSVSMVNEDINLVLTFNTPQSDFKEILSLVPAVYSTDFENIQTSGKMGIDGHVKGLYNETTLPAFDVNISIEDAEFKYPDLPQAVNNVNILTNIQNKGGDADNTIINVSKFHMELGQNPLDASLLVKTPISDPELNAKIKGKLDLGTIKDFYPLEEGDDLTGTFFTDITLQGKLSAIENEMYEEFTALGSMLIKGFQYNSSYTNDPVLISNAQLNFSPQYLDLSALKLTIGENDLSANGKIENYLAYAFKEEVLVGNFTLKSNYLNIDDLMPEYEEEEVEATTEDESESLTIVEVPGNIDFEMASSFKTLIYDSILMENAGGKLLIKDQRLILQNLSMNTLDGEMVVTGEYNTIDITKPEFDFNLDIKEIDIQKAYNTFAIVSEYVPIAKKTSGKFSTKMNMKSNLDQQMMPIYESMTGGGELHSTKLTIKDVNTLNKIGEALKYEEIKRMVIDKILFQFEFVDGKILVEPFDFKHQDFNAQIGGWTGMDKTIDYVMNMNIPRDKFGSAANNVLNNMVNQANTKGANFSLGETVSLDVLIGGTLTNPEISTSLKETGKNLVEDVKKQVKEEIQKKKEEISKEAREKAQKIIDDADAQGQKLIQEAQKQATKIRKNGSEAAQKIIDETDKQAKKVEDEGKSKGFLAEAAAKETAKQMRKEGDNQAKNVEDEADKQANNVVKKAKNKAAALKKKAQKEADKILGEK